MLRGTLLAAALLTLLGLGSGAGHVRSGRIAYVHVGSGDRFQIYTVTSSGANRRPLTTGRRYSSDGPAYAPRGRRIVFVRAFKQSDLWTMDADGTNKQPLTRTQHIDENAPAWSPDGKEIAFGVDKPAAQQGIWVIGANGQNREQLTTGADGDPSWSPDGSTIAFERYDAATQVHRIFTVPTGGGSPTLLSTTPGFSDLAPAWSPNGRRILFSSDRPDLVQLDLFVMNPDGSGVQRITNTQDRDEGGAAWSPDGRRIVYSGMGAFHGASSSQIYVSNANGTHPRALTHACGDCAYVNEDPSWQPLP
jgi:TolB protein